MVIAHQPGGYLSSRTCGVILERMARTIVLAAVALVAAVAIWHPVKPAAPHVLAPARAPMARRVRRLASPASDAVVYVAGAVAKPGIYRVPLGARAADAVAVAGGMLPGADALAVNLAARVSDGDEIAVLRVGESIRPAHVPRAAERRSRKRAPSSPGSFVNINTADAAALESVPGIGPALADRIVAIRDADGPFGSFDELLDVAGMTAARLERARPHLTI